MFEELNLRVLRLEGDTGMLMSEGRKRKEDSVGDGMVVENKTSESGKSQCETSCVGTEDANAKEKESVLKRDEVGSASDSMESGSNGFGGRYIEFYVLQSYLFLATSLYPRHIDLG